jgi:phosphoglycerate dehydrogenase-like enzyme
LQVVFDPHVPAERGAAFAEFTAHDVPDFAAWCAELRAAVPALVPAHVRLVNSQEQLRSELPAADAVVVESLLVGPAELALAPRLKVVQKFGVVTRNIDLAACAGRDVVVCTQRRRSNVACAEWAIMMMLALGKRLPRFGGRVTASQLTEAGYPPRPFSGVHTARNNWARIPGLRVLSGATLGLIGFGEIGREIALRARPFGVRTLYHQRAPLPAAGERELAIAYAGLDELLAESDVVSIQLPTSPATRGFLDRARLGRMKPGAFLINVARADLIERDALVAALQSGRLGGFALDPLYEVPLPDGDPLLACENVFLTPHIAAQPRFNALDDIADIAHALAHELSTDGSPA